MPGTRLIAASDIPPLNFLIAATGTPVTYPSLGSSVTYDINRINVTSDNMTVSGGIGPSALGVYHTFGGAAMQGYAVGIASYFLMNAKTGNANGNYVGMLSMAAASANDNGTAGTPSGSLWASNPNAFLANGATNWAWLAGEEIDVTAGAGSNVAEKYGLIVVQGSMDAVKGSKSNVAIAIGNQSGAQGWDCGLSFGSYSGFNPMSATATLIGTFGHGIALGVGSGSMGTVANGIDLSQYSYTGSAIKFPGFTVGNTGFVQQTPRASASLTVNGQLEFEATSNTSLTVRYRGSDGVTRSAVLTLA